MRFILLLTVCLLFPFASGSRAEDTPAWGFSHIEVDGASYELRCRRVDVTLQHGWPGELFVYRVYRNGRFCRSLEREGAGRFCGCRYAFEGRDGGPVEAEPFPDAEDPLGWMLVSGAICGNTHSKRICLITVREREITHGDPDTYRETRFVSKERPVLRHRGDLLEVWSSEQEWGGTGTWGSFFVPALRVVDREGRVRSEKLPSDVDTWPEDASGTWWIERIVAGMREESPDLMRSGASLIPWGDEDAEYLLKEHDLPGTPAAMDDLVEAVAELAAARARVDRLAGSHFP